MLKLNDKNFKAPYYLGNAIKLLVPNAFYRAQLKSMLKRIEHYDTDYISGRVNYYNRLSAPFTLPDDAVSLSELKPTSTSTYYFDLREAVRYFPAKVKFERWFEDKRDVPSVPGIVKSRPIANAPDNANSVLLKLNKIRHFNFVEDQIPFAKKLDKVVWRGHAKDRHHRSEVVQQFYQHPLCDIGQTNPSKSQGEVPWQTGFMSIAEQLRYKYVLSLEGNDVATNLKWIMSSNSLCFMRKPRYETWFMEGRLIPNQHYVLLRDDFADLEEKLHHYSENQDEALEIIHHAHEYVDQFRNKKREHLIALLVMQKYFELSKQVNPVFPSSDLDDVLSTPD